MINRDKLGQLLWDRYVRHCKTKDMDRALVAAEDYVRWQQKWRKPYYRTDSNYNGYPPRHIVRRHRGG